MIHSSEFKESHRIDDKAFTRDRSLTFSLLIVMMLRKSVKSLQLVLNEVTQLLVWDAPVSNAAYSKARKKLKPSALVEINRDAVVATLYADNDYQQWKGFRLIANDGSLVRLPESQSIKDTFGSVPYTNGKDQEPAGEHVYARASVIYDVLNRVAIDARLDEACSYEVEQTLQHFKYGQANDLWLQDRGYASYRLIAHHIEKQHHFAIRCSAGSFSAARKMLKGEGKASQIVKLKVPQTQRKQCKTENLPLTVTVRFVRVQLDTGEYEVLVTNLLDEAAYPTEEFAEIYWHRWGIETFYSLLKTRLNLENFTGLTAESVLQDFHACVLLSGLESVLTQDAQEQLDAKLVKNPQHVNHAVSFNAIKNHAFELLYSDVDIDEVMQRLTQLFLQNPTCDRPHRKPPRKKASLRQEADFLRRRKKQCF